VESVLAHRVAMRRLLAEHGVAQPAFAAVRTLHEGRTALGRVGVPAVLRPADGFRVRGVFVVVSQADVERHLHATLAESPTQEAILERPAPGERFVAVVRAEAGHAAVTALAQALQPPSAGWFVPSSLVGDAAAAVEEAAARAVRVLGVESLAACVDLIADGVGVEVVEVSPAPPRPELAVLLDAGAARPAAVRLLTGPPGPLPEGRVRHVGTLDKVVAFPGVVAAEVGVAVGETIEPMRVDTEPSGYVLATAETNLVAIERAEAAARLVDVDVW
jgi:hypothetical protein